MIDFEDSRGLTIWIDEAVVDDESNCSASSFDVIPNSALCCEIYYGKQRASVLLAMTRSPSNLSQRERMILKLRNSPVQMLEIDGNSVRKLKA